MHAQFSRPFVALLMWTAVVLAGCDKPAAEDESSSVDVSEVRAKLVLEEQPVSPMTVIELRDQLAEDAGETEVTVMGHVGGMPNPLDGPLADAFPWDNSQAVFFLVDPTTVEACGGHEHADGEVCMFCLDKAKKLKDTVAMVRFKDGEEPYAVGADKLLELEDNQQVVITGTAHKLLGMLVIEGEGFYSLEE